MLNKDYIIKLVNEAIEGTDHFLIDVKVSPKNKITVLIDSDHNIAINDCVIVSRHIEHHLDRDIEDFELEVSSPGIDQPLRHQRQYKKNVGRKMEVKLDEEQVIRGMLTAANDHRIIIQPEKIKKQKSDPEPVIIEMNRIKEAKLIIKI